MAACETIRTKVATDSSTKCKKCLNHYDDPRMLPCLHSFCKSCVGQLVIQTGSKKIVRCPTCYSTTPLPLKGVDVFPRNVRLSYEATLTKYDTQIKSEPPPSCDECMREPPLETVSFCCTCRSFLCTECHTQHTMSRKAWVFHKIVTLKEQFTDIHSTLKQHVIQPPISCSQHPEKNIEFFCNECNVLVCMQCALIQHHGHEFEELASLSQKKKDEIKLSVQSMPDSIAKLEETITKGMNIKKDIKPSKQAVEEQIRIAFKELRKELDKREKALLAKCSEISTAKETSLTIQLEELTSLKDQMVACTAVVTEVQESYNDTELLSVVTTLQTRVQELTQNFDKTALEFRENSSILLSVDTEVLKNEIKAFGSVTAHQPRDYTTLKDPVMTISSNTPYFIAVHDNGDIVVSSYGGNSINVFDKNGLHQKATFGLQHNGVTFQGPLGMDIVGDTVFVVEYSGQTVKKLTMTGELLLNFGNGQLKNPWGCAVSSSGMVYVADKGNNRVQVFHPDGTLSHTIGGIDQLKSPTDVAIDNHSNIHVASGGTKDIKVFTPNGALLKEYGKGVLKNPSGIVIDKDDYCLVGDWNGKSLWIFDLKGKLVHSITYPGCVCGVTLDKDGFVYVVDHENNKVHKY